MSQSSREAFEKWLIDTRNFPQFMMDAEKEMRLETWQACWELRGQAARAEAFREQLDRCSDWVEKRLSVQVAAAMRADLVKLSEAEPAAQQVTSAPANSTEVTARKICEALAATKSNNGWMKIVTDILRAPAEQPQEKA